MHSLKKLTSHYVLFYRYFIEYPDEILTQKMSKRLFS